MGWGENPSLWSNLLHAYRGLAFRKASPELDAYTLHINQSNRQVIRSNEYQEITTSFPLQREIRSLEFLLLLEVPQVLCGIGAQLRLSVDTSEGLKIHS